jgi:protein SCO1/2
MVFKFSVLLLLFAAAITGCERSAPAPKSVDAKTTNAISKNFEVKGVVIEVKPKEKSIEIKHEAIPGYMPAMTMPFDVKDVKELSGLKAGDRVSFRMVVTDIEGWIDHIRKLAPDTNSVSAPADSSPIRVLPNVEPLSIGDNLPQHHFTNQLGQPVSLDQFRGKALAITFLFTRCPFPNFCPRMANQFAEAQQKLEAMTNGPANWQLLTVSFDPEFDTPAVLKAYAERYKYDPKHWTFATGALNEVTALTEQAGLTFYQDGGGSISHNLRTLVFGADGKLRKNFVGNNWTSDDLVQELVKGSKP